MKNGITTWLDLSSEHGVSFVSICSRYIRAHKLVGMFDSYSQVERQFISCDCTFYNLDIFRAHCNEIIHDDIHNAIINKFKDELKYYSQHKLPEGTFFNVSTGG